MSSKLYKQQMDEKLIGYDEHQELLAMFESVVKEALPLELADSGCRRLETLLKCNAAQGGLFCARMTISCYRHLSNSACDDEEEIRLIYILAWCVELLETCFLVGDDMMDNSEILREKQPCWYQLDCRGVGTFHDALLPEQCAFLLLRKHFQSKACYPRLLGLFHKVRLQSYYGQDIDSHEGSSMKNDPEMEGYTREAYRCLVKYKGVVNYFYLPWAVAVTMAGLDEADVLQESWSFLVAGGVFLQARNDFLQVFGDTQMAGKICTDIAEGKLTWVIAEALRACTPEQRQILKANYGQSDPTKVAACKRVFQELEIPKMFLTYEQDYIEQSEANLERLRPALRAAFRDMFKELKRSGLDFGLAKCYARNYGLRK